MATAVPRLTEKTKATAERLTEKTKATAVPRLTIKDKDMGIFSKKVVPVFGSRSEAFDYMLAELVAKGRDMMDAAEQAGRFAEIVATNKRLPDVPAKERNMLEKGIDYAKQIAALKQENPEVWEIATSAIGGVIGAVGGGSVSIEEPVKAAIDFNSLE